MKLYDYNAVLCECGSIFFTVTWTKGVDKENDTIMLKCGQCGKSVKIVMRPMSSRRLNRKMVLRKKSSYMASKR